MIHNGDSLAADLRALYDSADEPVPENFGEQLEQARLAQQALRELLEETRLDQGWELEPRLPPAISGDYQIERELGHGGMGVVYLARQRSLNRQVAIKVLRPGQQTFAPMIHRFLDEARHLAQLRHPHIVSIFEVGDASGEPYFAMEYIEGETLAATLSRGALTPSRSVELFKQIASALQHAHRQGIVHRDLKPGNVLIDSQGQAFVTDFGLARNLSQDSSLTQSGELLGTPQYMAPEQARGQNVLVGEATDIHALGLLLYEMLAGIPAFQASSPAEVLVKLLREDPPDPRRLDRRIPRDLETICLKCLRKDPAARYPNVTTLLEDIRRFEVGEPLTARRIGWFEQGVRYARRHARLAVAILGTALVVLTMASVLFDKSFEELVVWGDEELATGNAAIAAQIYTRAWHRAGEQDRTKLADRMIQTCRLLEDPQAALELAMKVIEVQPRASFGHHDLLVAQTLVGKLRSQTPSGSIDIWNMLPSEELEQIKERLELAIAQGIPADMQNEIDGTYTAVKLALNAGLPQVRYLPDYLYEIPRGSEKELLAVLDDSTASPWNRGRVAMSLARRREAARDRAGALSFYQQAYGQMRSVYPMYSGVKASSAAQLQQTELPDAGECLLVRELVADIRRLDPLSIPANASTLEFEIVGESLPPGIVVDLVMELADPEIENPDQGLSHNLPRNVPLFGAGPIRVQVLDGTYRLRVRGHHSRWDSSVEKFARLLHVEPENWPTELKLQGNTVRLPPVRLRLAEELTLDSPENGALLSLEQAELTWKPISGATRYQIRMAFTSESPSPTTSYFLWVSTASPELKFSKLTGFERRQVVENLLSGRTGAWGVEAYDEHDRRIAISLQENRFIVVTPLTEEPPAP